MNIKKAYVELFEVLEANQGKKVSTIMPQLLELMTSKSGGGVGGKTFVKDDEGQVTHVFCYYHKKWEAVAECEYGSKAGTATGLNTMCKEGVSAWTKQQRTFAKGKENLLTKLLDGEVTQEEAGTIQDELEAERTIVVPREDGHGFDEMPS